MIRDRVALLGNQITNPQPSTDQTGAPDVTFGFTGQRRQPLPERHRRRSPSAASSTASANADQLLPALRDRARQPAGQRPADRLQAVPGRHLRRAAAVRSPVASRPPPRADLATQLRLGALPVKLVQISESQVSATLGSTGAAPGPGRRPRRPRRRRAAADRLLPRARPDRGRRPDRLRHLLLRADQADPDHDDAGRASPV